MEEGKKKQQPTSSFVTGAIALVFLVIGYEVALFVHKAAVLRIAANRDHPDTVYVIDPAVARSLLGMDSVSLEEGLGSSENKSTEKKTTIRRNAPHSPSVVAVREKAVPRKVENFRFDPNTVSVEDLQRLGFSPKQAQAIDNYRQKGGRYRRPADFAKSFVVADSVYARLEPYINIPRLDINRADSTALLALPGIGPYFAGKIVDYRERLGGYSSTLQLLEIYRFDQEKLDKLSDLITCSEPTPFAIWTLPEADLARHPHISREEARAIVLYRTHHKPHECTLAGLPQAGILSPDHAARLSLCLLAPAE